MLQVVIRVWRYQRCNHNQ